MLHEAKKEVTDWPIQASTPNKSEIVTPTEQQSLMESGTTVMTGFKGLLSEKVYFQLLSANGH